MAVIDNDDANQLYGRMMECCDIELAIESGQFKTIEDVLQAVKASSQNIQQSLMSCEFFKGNRSIPFEESELVGAQYEADFVADKH
jgi:hypothetical protein